MTPTQTFIGFRTRTRAEAGGDERVKTADEEEDEEDEDTERGEEAGRGGGSR